MKNFLLGTLLTLCGQALRISSEETHFGGVEYEP